MLDELFAPEWDRLRDLLGDDELSAPLRTVTLGLDVYRVYGDVPEDEKRFARGARTSTRRRPTLSAPGCSEVPDPSCRRAGSS